MDLFRENRLALTKLTVLFLWLSHSIELAALGKPHNVAPLRGNPAPTEGVVTNEPVTFESSLRPDGTLNVKVQGKGIIVVTTDGTLPNKNNPSDNTLIADGLIELIVTSPTILRAKSYDQERESPFRSQSFIPQIIDLNIRQLPRGYDVTDVYVTGPFRGWSDAADDAFKLQRANDGSYRIRLNFPRDERFVYKYLLKTRNGPMVWWVDPSAPQFGSAQFVNNYLVSGLETISKLFLKSTPGFVEEAALDLRLQPVAALDQGDRVVRVKVGFLAGDASAVSMVFDSGESLAFTQSSYRRENIAYDEFSGLVELPEQSMRGGFLLKILDGDRETQLLLGSKGLMPDEVSSTIPARYNFEHAFDFQFDAQSNTLNGQDIYQVPLWSIDAIWYQIFPERFRNGDTTNDAAVLPPEWIAPLSEVDINLKPAVRNWTSDWFRFSSNESKLEQAVTGLIPNATPRDIQRQIVISRRYGGDLEGIRQQIPYLKSLGINAIYLNPVFESDSNHKYDAKDYRHIDRHFGPMKTNSVTGQPELYPEDEALLASETIDDPSTWKFTKADKLFVSLVNELHANGIRVVIDGVFNHSASNSIFMKEIAKLGQRSEYFSWFEMSARGEPGFESKKCRLSEFYPDSQRYPEAANVSYDAWFGYCTLPNHREGYPKTVFHPGLEKHFFDVMAKWMAPQVVDGVPYRGVDGVRLDVYGDVSQDFWRLFRNKVKDIKPDALIIAEEWYDGFDILRGDQTDILMNYTARTLAESWFINTNPQERFKPSNASSYVDFRLQNHREHVKHSLWTMLQSHDTDRMISKGLYVNRGLSPRPQDGNSWDDGSVNRPDLGAPYSNDKPGPAEIAFFKSIAGFQAAYMGTPMIYYGDELGMWGADDPTNRKPMMWPDLFDGSQVETQCTTAPGIWCRLDPRTTFTMTPNLDLFATYARLNDGRKKSKALRRGLLNSKLEIEVESRTVTTGAPNADYLYLWGFERAFGKANDSDAKQEFAYFVSNQNLGRERMNFRLMTNWKPFTKVKDLIQNTTYIVNANGQVEMELERDRAVLLLEQEVLDSADMGD